MNQKYIFSFITLLFISLSLKAQINLGDDLSQINYSNPKEYEIGGITITGIQYIENNVLIELTGLTVGDKIKIPGDKITRAIENLWKQELFEDITISASKIQGDIIFLNINLKELPRLSKYSTTGIKKSELDNIRKEIKLTKGDVVTSNLIIRTKNTIKQYFTDKGYTNTEVNIRQKKDTTTANSVILFIDVNKKNKIKVHNITFYGNTEFSDTKLKHLLKNTKEKSTFKPFYNIDSFIINIPVNIISEHNPVSLAHQLNNYLRKRVVLRIFKSSKLIKEDYKDDKLKIIEKYNELGYRDIKIEKDTIYKYNNKTVNIDITINEGNKYYFRNITWLGNTKYLSEELNSILKIKKGNIYNKKILDANLYMNLEGRDISSLYMDDGYLFFNIDPVEVMVKNDSIDLEIRIHEGKQAIINKVSIKGNVKTNDNVIMREIRTKPGDLFSRSDIIRTQRELAQLRYFDAEKLAVNPKPNPSDGTVDIEYVVEETSSDQIELSGGWGAGRVIGTLGLSFNNFALKDFFKANAWRPIPTGNGQKLTIRAQSNGLYYQSYNASFVEPWLGGKKPNSFSVSVYNSTQSNGLKKTDPDRQFIKINGISFGLGKRLKWPDDYFTLYQNISFQNYELNNYYSTFSFNEGHSNNFSYSVSLARNSIDAPIYPRTGSEISLTLQMTPPYSLFQDKDYSTMSNQEKYKWIEYHKWKFNTSLFTKLIGNLVLNTRTKFGFLGLYNRNIGISPFERFYLGGDGLSGFSLDGREIIALRGYSNSSLTPSNPIGTSNYIGGTIYNKYTVEIRYPISLNPMATIYVLGFAEAGNAWLKFNKFNPFDIKKSVGIGVRIFLPMFGQLGLDWGYGFDDIPGNPSANKGQFHFSIGQSIE